MNYDLWGRRGMRPKLWRKVRDVVRREPYAMELHVEAAGITHWLALGVAAPQRGGGGLAVGAGEAHSARGRLQHRRQTLQAQGRCHGICFTRSNRGAGPPQGMLRCCDARMNRVPQPLTGAWDRGLGCRRQQILVVPAASATLSVTHIREEPSNHWAL